MNERGKSSVLIDNALLKYEDIDLYIGKSNGLSCKIVSPDIEECLNLLYNVDTNNKIDLKLLIYLIKKLSHINDYRNLSTLLDLAYNNEYLELCNLFYSPINNRLDDDSTYTIEPIKTFILNNMVFIVENKESFIEHVREKGYIVTLGPKSQRGHISSLNNFLNYLDSGYRDSLYNHYCYHRHNNSLPEYTKNYPLNVENFYFRNIHHHKKFTQW